jgi:hypothetical protein
MADYSTMTPGSSVADTVQQILQRRRDEQRQMMLDRLNVAKYQQDYDLQKRQENRMQHTADVQNSNLEDEMMRRGAGDLGYGESDVTNLEQDNAPLFNWLKSHNRIRTDQPKTSSSLVNPDGTQVPVSGAGPAGPARQMFTGSIDFQKDEEKRDRINKFFDQAISHETDPTELKNLAIMRASALADLNPPANMLHNTTRFFSPTGKILNTIEGRVGDESVHAGYPPTSGWQLQQPTPFQVPNGKGGYDSYWLKPGEQPSETNRIKTQGEGTVVKGNLPTGTGVIPTSLWADYTKASGLKDRTARASAMATAQSAIVGAAMQHGFSSDVVQNAMAIVDKAAKYKAAGQPVSVNQAMSWIAETDSDTQKQQIRSLLESSGQFNAN